MMTYDMLCSHLKGLLPNCKVFINDEGYIIIHDIGGVNFCWVILSTEERVGIIVPHTDLPTLHGFLVPLSDPECFEKIMMYISWRDPNNIPTNLKVIDKS